jgi:hypothetical protein
MIYVKRTLNLKSGLYLKGKKGYGNSFFLLRWGSLGNKRQLEVLDDAVHNGIIGEEGDDLHRPPGT